ncbi:sugar phosphate isomerase/epimerase family protein [Paracidobacterium acidisoli]|uniref:Sugar phosphate isomerase/epimerase n=1 Tax=Paracidobacterium acidisoli TaxID=2303751 RepID=A0A372IUA3_9BACT|nr:sugar phosphate isomerase/epimerase [Paracidobacterium acidisoli]MBT9329827.1 sugar phosphate isomerase/epimerase [Paracidobacterium acidisoli]
MPVTRRTFLGSATAVAAAALFLSRQGRASALGLPVSLQLYSVRTLLPNDFDGTLKQLAALGYREVEAAGFYNRSADSVKASMQAAGLRCVSAHYPLGTLQPQLDSIIEYGRALGLAYIVCSSPMHKQPGAGRAPLSLDDWRWNADQFNQVGEKIRAAGMHFAYHNHMAEFGAIDGVLPYDELLKHTDPAKVSFELDCGWVVVGGQSPVDYLKRHGSRMVMLHVKDFKDNKPPSVELGAGSIDYAPIFAAAAKYAHIRHCFVEQEEFQTPIMDALKVDAQYMQRAR